LEFRGIGANEKAFVKKCSDPDYQLPLGKEVLNVDPAYFRPTEVDLLVGDATKARTKLGWELEHDLSSLVQDMMESDLQLIRRAHPFQNVLFPRTARNGIAS